MASNLKGQSPVTVATGGVTSLPAVQLFENIPTLHQVLQEIVNDWHRGVQPYNARIAAGQESAEYVIGLACLELQPTLLKCLFSYVFFFVAADHAYAGFYAGLNRANELASLHVKHAKPPHHTPLVEKARLIRNWSIAHFSSAKANRIDAYAAMSWTPLTLSRPHEGPWDLKTLTFGGFRLRYTDESGRTVQSRDLQVQGLDELHQECLAYLEAYDKMCIDYLAALRTALNATPRPSTGSEGYLG
jgi:hypothetical protein